MGNDNRPVVRMVVRFGDREIELPGREAWAMDRLIANGETGCTPIDQPAPRWSSYAHKLRRRGFAVVTVTEMHAGAYAGKHARYVLKGDVEVVEVERLGDKRSEDKRDAG